MNESTYEIKNENQNAENNQPHYNGNGKDLNGNDFQVSAWLTTSKAGKKYFSCKLQEPYNKQATETASDNVEASDPDLPF